MKVQHVTRKTKAATFRFILHPSRPPSPHPTHTHALSHTHLDIQCSRCNPDSCIQKHRSKTEPKTWLKCAFFAPPKSPMLKIYFDHKHSSASAAAAEQQQQQQQQHAPARAVTAPLFLELSPAPCHRLLLPQEFTITRRSHDFGGPLTALSLHLQCPISAQSTVPRRQMLRLPMLTRLLPLLQKHLLSRRRKHRHHSTATPWPTLPPPTPPPPPAPQRPPGAATAKTQDASSFIASALLPEATATPRASASAV